MFCRNCGSEIEEGVNFCSLCGTKLLSAEQSADSDHSSFMPKSNNAEETAQAETAPIEAAVQVEPVTPAQPVAPAQPVVPVEPVAPQNPKKKKGKGGLIALLIVLVVIIAGVLAVVLNLKAIKNLYYKTTLSPDEYCHYVLEESAHMGAANVARVYDETIYNAIFIDNVKTSTGMSVNVSEEGVALLEDLSDEKGFEVLTDLDGKYTVQHKGGFVSSALSITTEGDEILALDLIFDQENEIVYLGIPSAGSDYMSFELDDFYDDDEIDELYDNLDMIAAIGEVSIKPAELQKIIEKYQDILIENIEGVTLAEETLEVEGVSQKLTTLSFTADIELMANMYLDVIDELANDEEIKEYYIAYSDAAEIAGAEMDYDDFLDELDDLKDEIEDADLDEIDKEIDFVIYVNGLGDISGIRVNTQYEKFDYREYDYVDRDVEFFCGYTVAGGKFGFLMNLLVDDDEEWSVTGSGTVKNCKFTGDFDIDYSIINIDFSVRDLDFSKIDKGIVNGTIIVDLHQFKKFGLPSELKNTLLVLDIEQSSSSEKMTVSLTDEDENNLISVSSYTLKGGSANVTTPSSIVECEDAGDVQDFLEDQDFTLFINKLEDYGVEDVDDYVDDVIDGIEDVGTAPISILYIPEVAVNNSYAPVFTGTMVPQLIRYINKSKVSSDIQLADTISTACETALFDPDVADDDCYNDVYYELYYGTYITDWGKPSNKYQEEVADILGIDDFSELEDMIKSDYSGEGIYIEYDGWSDVSVELRNTDKYGNGDLSGWCNIRVY